MKSKYEKQRQLKKYFRNLFFIIFLFFLVLTSNKKIIVVASNINIVKSITSSRIGMVDKTNLSNFKLDKEDIKYFEVYSIEDLLNNKDKLISFNGTLTGYGADCEGCNGYLACNSNINVSNNNIYYNDLNYGTVRILAADKSIPCGSIVKIQNYLKDDILGIVLDRGSAINGLTMDLLFNSEDETQEMGRAYNIKYYIERWGY